jgi:hypothetical protein
MTEQQQKNTGETSKKEDVSVLFPEAKVGDIIIKPWGFGMLFDISGSLEKVLDKVEEKGINLAPESGFIPYTTFARLFTIAGSEVLKIIALTIDMSEEEVKKLDMDTGIKIVMIIYQQNKEVIKKSLAPLLSPTSKKEKKV